MKRKRNESDMSAEEQHIWLWAILPTILRSYELPRDKEEVMRLSRVCSDFRAVVMKSKVYRTAWLYFLKPKPYYIWEEDEEYNLRLDFQGYARRSMRKVKIENRIGNFEGTITIWRKDVEGKRTGDFLHREDFNKQVFSPAVYHFRDRSFYWITRETLKPFYEYEVAIMLKLLPSPLPFT